MEPQQPGSPTSPPFSPGTTLWDNNARAATPSSEEMAAPDEINEEATDETTKEEATELEPARKSSASSSSSSSSSSSASSADIPCDIDVVELVNPLAPALPMPDDEHGGDAKVVHSATPPEDERAAPDVHPAEAKPADCAMPADGHAAPAVAVHSAEAKPDDWVTWPEPPPPAVDDSFASSDGGGGGRAATTEAPPQVQTAVSPANPGAAGGGGFDPGRIPASVFQHRTSVSQAEWSMASNESLFSIQGASDLYPAGSRSHFDFYYDEAMAAETAVDSKLPSLAEGAEPGDAPESRELRAPGSAESAANDAKKAAVFRRQESGSGGSSSNFSFAFPILAETSPRKKDVVNSALYRPLEREVQQPPPPPPLQLEPPVSAFMEMTTEEERRRSDSAGCCCCGCCWFDCSWWCRCPWWRCGCCCYSCSCPSFCRCSWCLCS